MNKSRWCSALLLVSVLLWGGVASGADLYVPGGYATIQAAINAASPGDVIHVAAGTYQESLGGWRDIEIFKSISLIGAGSGSTIVELSGLQHGVEIRPDATGVVLVEGIAFTKRAENTYSAGWGIIVGETGGTFSSLIFRDVEIAYAEARNLHFANATYTYALVDDCTVHHSGAWGFSARGVLTDLNIVDSDFEYNGTAVAANGIGFDIDMPTTVTKVTVSGGSFSHNKAKGINLNQTHNATFTGITANSNAGAPGGGFGICLWEWSSASSGITVVESTLENNSTDGILFGTEGTCTITGISVQKCRITGNGRSGILFYHNLGGSASNIAINGCYLDGNGSAGGIARSALSSSIDGSANWWGVATPDGVAAKAGTNLDYTPWLASGTDLSTNPGFQADWSVLWVDDNSPQTGTTGRVQEGVDLVSGSTVYLAPGTYEEQVEITKTMTLDGGGGGGAVIKSPLTLTKYFQPGSLKNYPIIYVHDCDGVTVKNLTVDGAGRGNANYRFQGIGYWNAGGTVDHCVVKDIKDTPFSGAQHGVAIYSYSSGTTAYAVNVWDCEIYGFQKNAMAINAGDTNPFTADIRRNVVTGASATTVTAQNGIQVWADLGTGHVADNIISGIGYSGSDWVATSILNYYADLNITGNTISDAHLGIYNIDGSGTIAGNALTISKIGDFGYGICASDPPNAKPSPFGAPEESSDASGPMLAGAQTATTLNVNISNNDVTFSGTCDAGTVGIEADAGYGPNDIAVTMTYNTVTGFGVGIGIYKCTGSSCYSGVFTDIQAHYNSIFSNCGYGMQSNVDYLWTDARNNWWGHATGPFNAAHNPGGLGNQVSDYIYFDPWMTGTNVVSLVPDYDNTCSDPLWYTFHIDRAGAPEHVRGYEVKFQITPAVVTITNVATDVEELGYLDDASSGAGQFYCVANGGGVYTASGAILGGDVGATGNGDLFRVKLTPVAPGISPISLVSLKLRDLDNQALPIVGVGGSVQVECNPPWMQAIVEPEDECYNEAPTFSVFTFRDDVGLDLAEYQIDDDGWNTIFTGLAFPDTVWSDPDWELPGFSGLDEGSHTVYFRVKDDAGNWNGEGSPQPNLYSWSFVKDTVAPSAPTNLVALPGHNKVHLTWTNPTDPSFAGVEIWRKGWGDYPQYGTPGPSAPTYPATYAEYATLGWTLVTTSFGAAYDDGVTPRDIYYYALFTVDCAGNYSAVSSTSQDRSTSYWLGDIAPTMTGSGDIQLQDLSLFSLTFGQIQVYPAPPVSPSLPQWNPEGDFGPTDDHSRFGVPTPDDAVDFEDLMIFAMNYGKVSPSGTSGGLLALTEAVPLNEQVSFRLVLISREDGKATYAVLMENGAKVLKGFSLKVAYGANLLESVTASRSLTGKASEHFFGVIERESGVAEICVAALGIDTPFGYAGEVARIVVREETEGSVGLKSVDLRDLNNNGSKVTLPGTGGETPYIPVTTTVMQNHPNPFNPTTTIAFDVATAGNVRIAIYDVSGALVRTLVNEEKGVGRHVATWDGRDGTGNQVHTGVYFYRMTAPGYTSQAKKMLLLK